MILVKDLSSPRPTCMTLAEFACRGKFAYWLVTSRCRLTALIPHDSLHMYTVVTQTQKQYILFTSHSNWCCIVT